MGSTNQNLGQYDMVLALSQSKINFEMGMLYKQGLINPRWQFFTGLDSAETLTNADSSFDAIKKGWLDKNELTKKITGLKNELEKIQDEMDDADGDRKKELRQMRDQKKTDIKTAEEQAAACAKYRVLMDVVIQAPQIELITGSNSEMLLLLKIKEGNLHYMAGDLIEHISLEGKVYAFRVPIGRMQVTTDAMYLVDGAEMKKLRDGGLNDNDFTVDSMLLNFENANIAQYSEQHSVLPPNAIQITFLQLAITNYFKGLSKTKNPYVLGYAITKKRLADREKAMLYPTGASFSTSASANKTQSAFNFLLLTENHQFPSGATAGRIDKSLIEFVRDTTATASGVISINYDTFVSAYLDKLHATVVENLKSTFAKSFPGFYGWHETNGSNEDFKFTKHNLDMNLTLTRNGVRDGDDNYIYISYSMRANGNVHEEIPIKVVFGLIGAGTVGADQKFSTEGQYEINGKKGSTGYLTIKIGASDKGKLEVITDYQAPSIGRNTEKPECKSNLDAVWLDVSRFLNPFGLIGVLVSLFVTDDPRQNIIKFDGHMFKPFEFDSIRDFSNKVVLPGSNVYTFKNVRLLNKDRNGNDAVLFDIAYAAATN